MSGYDADNTLAVVALGGNALVRPGQGLGADEQRATVAGAMDLLAPLADRRPLVITHGNGPQVGMLARGEGANAGYPLDVLDAETEGLIGYLIEQELANRLASRQVATLLTQVEVDPHDPAFLDPVKPVGPAYEADHARRLGDEHGWTMGERKGGWRRLVASPKPRRVRELDAIRLLGEAGVVVICAGGGGIPAVRREDGVLMAVEAVVDKDWISALLARELGAGLLLLLTDVEAVWAHRGEPGERAIRAATPDAIQALSLEAGTMGPKVEAACEFVTVTGRPAVIGALGDAPALVAGEAGTRIEATAGGLSYW